MELTDIDLNLLVVFNQVLTERSVSKAADTLGVTQSSVSNSLARLRITLGDQLFLRTPRGMEPTPFAEQLAEPVAYVLGALRSALNHRMTFDPATSKRTFTIGMTDVGEITILPALMDALERDAPGVSISTVRNTADNLKDEMEAGHVDLAIGLLPKLQVGFFQRRLLRQGYVCIFRKGHRLDKRKISLKEFSAAAHVVVIAAGTGHGKVDELLDRSGVKRQVRLTVPHYVALGHILQTTDMVATVPEVFAEKIVGPFGLTTVAHPAAMPEIAINLFWHAKYHKDPANQWLRGLVFRQFSSEGS